EDTPAAGEQRRLERELHAMISVASAVAAVQSVDDVVEVAAEQALAGVDASSLAISRWDAQRRVLRTLINVGELAPGEQRRPADQPPFSERDARFLQTISGQIAAAIGRAELFSRMTELAFEDGLTGLANRRAMDDRLELTVAGAAAAGRDLALILCDVDELK